MKAHLDVYRHAGGGHLRQDPRLTQEYKAQVVKGLGLQPRTDKMAHLPQDAVDATIEVMWRKSTGYWVPDTPRTTVRFFQHVTSPTGPPCRLPPPQGRTGTVDRRSTPR